MSEVVFIVKCGPPMTNWYHVYASGRENSIIYEQTLEMFLREYNSTNCVIKYRFKCKDSVNVKAVFMQKARADHLTPDGLLRCPQDTYKQRGDWFNGWVPSHGHATSVDGYIKKTMSELIS